MVVGVPDLVLSPTAMAMQGVAMADIELCDSLGRTVDAWRQVPLGAEGDTAVAAAVYRFMLRRVGYAELLLYRPTEWDPRQMETFTYIIPTMKAESSRKKSLNFKLYNMGLINNIKDAFNKAEFTVAPNKKLKTLSADFKKSFDLTLCFYKGATLADPELTLAALNKKTTKEVDSKADGLKIKGSMKVGDVEKLFDQQFGVTVQVKDKAGKTLVPNGITLGQAARGEY